MLDLIAQLGLSDAIADYVGCRHDCAAVLADASPVHRVSGCDTPMEIFNSTQELVPMTAVWAMAARLRAHHVSHQLVIYEGAQHGVSYADKAMAATIAYLHEQLG
jgi:acetyl esterase/lipase